MKPTDRTTFVLAIIVVAFLLIVSALTAQAQSCVTPSDDAEYCLVGELTPFVPTATPVPTVAPTQQPVPTVTVVTVPWKRFVYLPIGAKP